MEFGLGGPKELPDPKDRIPILSEIREGVKLMQEGRLAEALDVAREKIERRGLAGRVELMEGDALSLPFPDGTFDAVTIAFGLRNLPDYAAGVAEMARVLRPGGRLLVLEFFPPEKGIFLRGYRFYLGRILPVAGRIISGSNEAYHYLARSIETFISDGDLRSHMAAAGLASVDVQRLTGGVASIYRAVK